MEKVGFLDLNKSFELNLTKANILQIPKLATRLAADKSGSMSEEFACGWVDHAIQLFLVAAMKFDDDKRLELGFFNTELTKVRDLTEQDIDKPSLTRALGIRANNGTNYSPVIEEMADYPKGAMMFAGIFGRKQHTRTADSYLGFITDGDCADFDKFEKELRKVTGTFIQMIAIGNQVTLGPLRSLERELDYLHVMHLPSPKSVTHDKFYEELCNPKFKAWIDLYGSKK